MKAVVIHAAKDLRIEDRPSEDLRAGQVRIAMASGGICGSDLHYYNHGGFGPIKLKEPMILGHEVAGHITELGEGVTGLRVGQLVAISPSRPCMQCEYCARAQYNHCMNMRFYGSAMPFPHIQGAFRQELIAEAVQCAPADGLTPGEAAMGEPLAVALHATKRAGEMLGKSVLVTGCGPIGIVSILAARRAGADLIVATDLSDFTLELARKAGADETINVAKYSDRLDRYAKGKGSFDLQYECSGAAPAIISAVPSLRPGATLLQLGLGGDMTLPMQAMTAKELTLKGSFRFHEEFFTGVSLMQKGYIDVKPFISHQLRLSDAKEAFELASDRSQAMKVQLQFS